jgi:hypothetical protein
MELELRANLNNEDDDGLNWGLLRDAADPAGVRPGAVLRAGTRRFWSWVRVVRVDEDGQVHFVQISPREAREALDSADAHR